MSEDHIADEDSQHENSLCEILKPLPITYEIPVRDDSLAKDTVIVLITRAVGMARVVEGLTGRVSTGEVHRWRKEYNAHLMPRHRKLDEEHNEANPYLPLADGTDSSRQRVLADFLALGVFCFVIQHWNLKIQFL